MIRKFTSGFKSKAIITIFLFLLSLFAKASDLSPENEKQRFTPQDSIGSLSTLTMNNLVQFFKDDMILPEQMQVDFEKLNALLNTDIGEYALAKKWDELIAKNDQEGIDKLFRTEAAELFKEKCRMGREFVKDNKDSYVSLYLLLMEKFGYTADGYAVSYHTLSDRVKATSKGRLIEQEIEQLKITTSGTIAIDFSRNDQKDNAIKLSAYQGKYVLLDFWGSWCTPCRLSHPHLKELYAKYKEKGFEIIAIAKEKGKTLEERQSTWLTAIEEDNIPWIHVLNDEGTDAPDIIENYGIKAYPTKILLDKEGKILMRISGSMNDEMDHLLAELLK